MSSDKVQFPSPGCLVEFLQGNGPVQALVLEAQNGRLRLYSIGKREVSLPQSRILPWTGPHAGANLSRQRMDETLEDCRAKRAALAAEISAREIWELAQGEVRQASAEWLAGLLWDNPGIDREAALGHSLLAAKTHFRFSPPDFEIFTDETVQKRLEEAESVRRRESFAATGAQFFHKLWDIHTKKRPPLDGEELGEIAREDLYGRLKDILLKRIADPEQSDEGGAWKLLCKGLPDIPHLPLLLAEAWGIVPAHYNFHLERIGYERGEGWAREFAGDCAVLAEAAQRDLELLEPDEKPYISIDGLNTLDRDDAFYLESDPLGFNLRVALACPALVWPFRSPLDRAVQRRASSLYLPEGDEHMLPGSIGRNLFSLDEGMLRPALVFCIHLSNQGEILSAGPRLCALRAALNLDLANCESLLAAPPVTPVAAMLHKTLGLAGLLQKQRLNSGAVIIERPEPELELREEKGELQVNILSGPEAPFSHMLVEELMVLCNSIVAAWAQERDLPLLYRTQNVALPREACGVWSDPQDIARIVRLLPAAILECRPRRHAGLGLEAYATVTSPIRRYVDLLNQGQVAGYLRSGSGVFSAEELNRLLPQIASAGEVVGQVQRLRPRYWKYIFFRQQGDKRWWEAVVAEENENFISVALPWAQITARGKRRNFDEKIYPGMRVQVRLGKIDPLPGDMQILELMEG
ncbi:MAG: RNB domain-containing ribonuclease [Desulfovibrio sp.]|jgi:exoribonuclease-2|nr:RNB domain-containing ribonuclease [Desulfovibrio sp.]